jgi:hypothetical protein
MGAWITSAALPYVPVLPPDLRASFGLVTTFGDVYKYVQFAETFIDRYVAG